MPNFLTGKVLGLEVNRSGVEIVLDHNQPVSPKDNRFLLPLGHPNYNAIYSLVVAAAANRWGILIRIAGDQEINPSFMPEVKYISRSWK